MKSNECINQGSKMNVVDCFKCVSIPLCLKKNPSAKELDGDEKDVLIQSVKTPEVVYDSSLKAGACGLVPFLASNRCEEKRRRKDDECTRNGGCWRNEKNISPAFLG